MLLPVFEPDTRGARVPWVSLALAAVWVGAFALGIADALPAERFGLRPAEPALPGAIAFFALHANGIHLAVSLALLAVVGPALEDRWGRIFFATFLALAIALQGIVYPLATPDSERPLVGASAALAGLIAAATIRFLRGGLTLRAGIGPRASRMLWLPGFALPALWLAGAVAVDAASALNGATGGIHLRADAAVALLGALLAGVVQIANAESRWLRRAGRSAPERKSAALLAQAQAETGAGRPEAAYQMLEQALDAGTPDPRAAIALLDAGLACGRHADALARAACHVADAWNSGRRDDAVQVWQRVVMDQPEAPLDTRLRLAIAPLLAAAGHRRAAALTLRGELRERGGDLSPGAALRIAELARAVHPDTAIEAAQRALRSDALDTGKRGRIEAMIRELEGDPARLEDLDLDPLPRLAPASGPEPDLACAAEPAADAGDFGEPRDFAAGDPGGVDDPRAIQLDPGEEFAADPERADRFADLDGFSLDPEEEAAPAGESPRFTSCKVIEVAPRMLSESALRVAMSDGAESTLPLARIQAIALVAVREQGGRLESRPTRSPQGREAAAQRGEAERSVGPREGGQASAGAPLHELGTKPVLLLDMLLNWNDAGDEPLKIARARGDRFDLRALAAALLARSGALGLPDPAAAVGDPVRVFDTLADYERQVLRLGSNG